MDYYLHKLKAAPSVLKYIANSKLVLASKDGSTHIKSSKYTAVFTGRDGSHCTGIVVCVGRGMVCQKPTLGIPMENPNSLPKHCPWDHAIKLTSDYQSPRRKLYPLSPIEQAELDKFLEENLASG